MWGASEGVERPAVDRQHLSGDIGGGGRGEIDHRPPDLLGRAEAAHRDALVDPVDPPGVLRAPAPEPRRAEPTPRDRLDAHAALRQTRRPPTRPADEGPPPPPIT